MREIVVNEKGDTPNPPSPPSPPDLQGAPLSLLKTWIRSHSIPLESSFRHDLWPKVIERSLQEKSCLRGTECSVEEVDTRKLPRFVDPNLARFFLLNERGRREVTSLLWQIQLNCPQVTSAPLLFPLTALFLHFSPPEDVFRAIYSLISASGDRRFLALSKVDRARDAVVLLKLTNRFGLFARPLAQEARVKLRNNALDVSFAEYLQWIVCLPFGHVVRVVDCFLIEGEKFLFRTALALALIFEKTRRESISLEKMRNFCQTIDRIVSPQQLIRTACKLTRLSRKEIQRARIKAEKRDEHVVVGEVTSPKQPDLIQECVIGARIAPRRFRCQSAEWAELDQLWEWLPERVVVREPLVLFNSEENGFSLQTFFGLLGDSEPTLLLITSTQKELFGAFCSTAWSRRLLPDSAHFGTGETFLFSLRPRPRKFEWVGLHRESVAHAQQLFQSASNKSLCVGSGGGRFGLFVEESLTRGRSERCETFENEPLARDQDFDIRFIEVLAFV